MGRRGLYDRRLRARSERWSPPGRLLAAALAHPELLLALTRKAEPVERGGRVLNRGVQALLECSSALEKATTRGGGTPDPVETRDVFEATTKLVMPSRTDVHVTGRRIPGPEGAPDIPIRVYRRFGVGIGRPDERPSAITYFHGGGWVIGSLDSHDGSCRLLAAVTGCVVVAVDYRLAPEHPFPAAVDDCLAAYAWVQRSHRELGTAPGRVGVMGDSAGGNLAAVVALATREGDVPPPVAQGLVYPALDARLDSPSMHELGQGFFLTHEGMVAFRGHYLPDPADWETWQVSPLLAADKRGVAPALIVTAGFDPLRDDGAGYARELETADVAVEYRCYDDMVHGFFGMGAVPDCLALATEVCDAMGALMRRATRSGG
ncbi:MAG TPA: alpha/beta hydrolase [Acidimicrobiales bacterium]